MQKGYERTLENDFLAALTYFDEAQAKFLKAGNKAEAEAIARHFLAYCQFNTAKEDEAYENLRQAEAFTGENKYRWLHLLNVYWVGSVAETLEKSGGKSLQESFDYVLENARQMDDSYLTQQILTVIVSRYFFTNQTDALSENLELLLKSTKAAGGGSYRQKVRALSIGSEVIWSTSLNVLTKEITLEGLSFARETGNTYFITDLLIKSAVVNAHNGNVEEGFQLLSEAERKINNESESEIKNLFLSFINMERGHFYKLQNKKDLAIKFYDRSTSRLKSKRPFYVYEALKSKLLLSQELGRSDEVEEQLPEMFSILEKYRSEILAEREKTFFFSGEQTIYDIAVKHYHQRGDLQKSYLYNEISSSRTLLNWLKKNTQKIDQSQKNKLSTIEEETAAQNTDSKKIKPFTAPVIRAKLSDEVQLLQYQVAGDELFIWVLSRDDFISVKQKIDFTDLKSQVNNFRKLVENGIESDSSEIEYLSRKLYEKLILPVEKNLNHNKQIIIIPDKFLYKLPFAALSKTSGKGAVDKSNRNDQTKNRYLIEDYVISYAPSANVFLEASKLAARLNKNRDQEKIISFGNPAFDQKAYKKYKLLPDAESEIREISKLYDRSKSLSGSNASEKQFLDSVNNYDIVHFAGHYIVKDGQPLRSGLLFAANDDDREKGLLTNKELLNYKFSRPKLIVLSACETGVEDYFYGEGLNGLTRTFMVSGIPLVVGSNWSIDSEATRQLITDFHKFRQLPTSAIKDITAEKKLEKHGRKSSTEKSISSAQALQQAQVEMIHSKTKRLQHPYYWSAFGVFGGFTDY